MKEIEINVLTKLSEDQIEKELDEIDKIISERLQTDDIMIFTKEYKDE